MFKHGHASNYNGKTQTPTYNSWRSMIQRCYNPNHNQYNNYGGRGIIVCDEWFNFVNFLLDMGERPEGYSLDRITPDSNYSKDTCRWATQEEQCRNKRTTKLSLAEAEQIRNLKVSGLTIFEISILFDVSESTIKNVIYRGDWS